MIVMCRCPGLAPGIFIARSAGGSLGLSTIRLIQAPERHRRRGLWGDGEKVRRRQIRSSHARNRAS
jgi:hypothetical protein